MHGRRRSPEGWRARITPAASQQTPRTFRLGVSASRTSEKTEKGVDAWVDREEGESRRGRRKETEEEPPPLPPRERSKAPAELEKSKEKEYKTDARKSAWRTWWTNKRTSATVANLSGEVETREVAQMNAKRKEEEKRRRREKERRWSEQKTQRHAGHRPG